MCIHMYICVYTYMCVCMGVYIFNMNIGVKWQLKKKGSQIIKNEGEVCEKGWREEGDGDMMWLII